MAQLATCPFCTTQLALPDGATLSDRARCPRCSQEFLLMETVQFSIPTAEILPPVPPENLPRPEPYSEFVEERRPQEDELFREPSEVLGSTAQIQTVEQPITSNDPSEERESPAPEEELPMAPAGTCAEPENRPGDSTLSHWEARLKRAIAGNLEQSAGVESGDSPSYVLPAQDEYQSAKASQPFSKDDEFEVPETDLFPVKGDHPAVHDHLAQDLDDWSPKDMHDEIDANNPSHDADVRDVSIVDASPRRKRKRSIVRTLISAGLGIVGIPIGLYVLLLLRGPAGDIAGVAQYVPSFMLPGSFDILNTMNVPAPEQVARESPVPTIVAAEPDTDSETDNEIPGGAEQETIAETPPIFRNDPVVAPASAQQSLFSGPIFEPVIGAEFTELLTAAETAAAELAEGDLRSKESVSRKGQAYIALARLADKSSFLYQPGLSDEDVARTRLARQLFEVTLRDPNVQRDLPQIASRWWQYAERPSSGMILTGRVQHVEPTEAGFIAHVALNIEQIAPTVPVLLGEEAPLNEAIGIVGSIVTDPAVQMPSLDAGDNPLLISHHSFPLSLAPEAVRGGTDNAP